jgi:hypothetical protein
MGCNLQYVGYTIIRTKLTTTSFEGCMVVGYGQCWAGIKNELRTKSRKPLDNCDEVLLRWGLTLETLLIYLNFKRRIS